MKRTAKFSKKEILSRVTQKLSNYINRDFLSDKEIKAIILEEVNIEFQDNPDSVYSSRIITNVLDRSSNRVKVLRNKKYMEIQDRLNRL